MVLLPLALGVPTVRYAAGLLILGTDGGRRIGEEERPQRGLSDVRSGTPPNAGHRSTQQRLQGSSAVS